MRRPACLPWFTLLAVLALWPAGCSQPTGTYVMLKFTGTVSQSQPIHSIMIDLQFDGTASTATATFQMPNGADIKLDTSAVLDVQHGAGPLTVGAKALAADGGLLGSGSGWGTVVRGKTAEIVVTFSVSVPDAGVDSLPPADVLPPGLDGIADLRTKDTLDAAADVPANPDVPGPPDSIDRGPESGGDGSGGAPDAPNLGGAGGGGGAGGTAAGGTGGGTTAGGAGGNGSGGSGGGYALTVNPTSVDFGVVAPGSVSPPKTLTITNVGDAPTPALTLSISDSKSFPVGNNQCNNLVLAPKATCTVDFKFAPTATGPLRADGSVDSVGGGPGVKFTLSGTGAGGAASLTLSPSTATFGTWDVGMSASIDFTLSNGGDKDVGSITIQIAGPNAFQVTNSGCSNGTLGPRSQCVFTVTFSPTAYGAYSATVNVQSSSGLAASATITGTGRSYTQLTINFAGKGAGVINGTNPGCPSGAPCTFQFTLTDSNPAATPSVTLSAAPDSQSTFGGWTGDCTGTGTCTLTMNVSHSVTATFNPRTATLNLTVLSLAGHTGSLVSSDGSVSCSGDCPNLQVPVTNTFILNATAASGSTFAGWTSGPTSCKGLVPKCTFALTDTVTITATFGPQSYVFVSSSTVIPGKLGGLSAADAECTRLATNAGLPGTYAAWLSTSSSSTLPGVGAGSRVGQGGWLRTDGRPFARDLRSLVDPASYTVLYPPRLDERANDLGTSGRVLVATGSQPDGTFSGSNCKDYTDTSTAASLTAGDADSGSYAWTDFPGDIGGCGSARHLYCFRTDLPAAQLSPPPQNGRRAFISTNAFVMATGASGTPSDLCRKDAASAGLANPAAFVAFLATTGTPAGKLVNPNGLPWRRMDGVFVTQLPTDLADGKLLAPIDVMADGKTYTNPNNSYVWTGATDPTLLGTMTCGDWTGASASTNGLVGDSETAAVSPWFDLMSIPCNNNTAHLYCVEP